MLNLKYNPRTLRLIGNIVFLVGVIAIYLHLFINLAFLLRHTLFDTLPADEPLDILHLVLFTLIPSVGIPSILGFLFCVETYFEKNKKIAIQLALILSIFVSTTINASFFLGGGWYIGSILANIGLGLILFSAFRTEQFEIKKKGSKQAENNLKAEKRLKKKNLVLPKKLQLIFTCILICAVMLSAIIPLILDILTIPQPLIDKVDSPSSDTPNHRNTFYILPIWEGVGTMEEDISQMHYIESIVGGSEYTGEGFIKIGRSVSCWYTNEILEDGTFNDTRLIHKLNVSAQSNTPILFHMNGGNWGQATSEDPVILEMRQNVSNCQWDQTGYCHPIRYSAGPNARYWSFWPDSDWEKFRERNIKQALDVIYDWWLLHPDLLVGFSTDSEIHLNDKGFEEENKARTGTAYRSYFDYNNGTIEQYRQWAQSNWTLQTFNSMCETAFTTWDEVDAPRDETIVGNKNNDWWEIWTDFRIWHVKEAGKRQCRWINESGFPRDMIWHHQILTTPGEEDDARYIRADVLDTAINQYCKLGVTRYNWISPKVWHSLGTFALEETQDEIPSWGIFEWNLPKQHQYWAYEEMLKCIYQYGGHVICPNEWANCSYNEVLWIPGIAPPEDDEPPIEYNETTCCCLEWNEEECTNWILRHGNPQFLAALRDFVQTGQEYSRGTCPYFHIKKLDISYYGTFDTQFNFFNTDGLYIMGGLLLFTIIYVLILINRTRVALRCHNRKPTSTEKEDKWLNQV
ncbi:MAG: hypothetical protein GF364_22310 [Candidatus Lokiarchaeota archaeon]|nr:hypothetical protein [Candidatus Lokiarchaeota archaeon]